MLLLPLPLSSVHCKESETFQHPLGHSLLLSVHYHHYYTSTLAIAVRPTTSFCRRERERKVRYGEERESPKVAHANLQLRSTNGQAKKKPSLARSLAHSKRLFERARFPAKRDPHPVCKVSCAQLGKERRKKVRPYQFSLSLILSRRSISLVKSV